MTNPLFYIAVLGPDSASDDDENTAYEETEQAAEELTAQLRTILGLDWKAEFGV